MNKAQMQSDYYIEAKDHTFKHRQNIHKTPCQIRIVSKCAKEPPQALCETLAEFSHNKCKKFGLGKDKRERCLVVAHVCELI